VAARFLSSSPPPPALGPLTPPPERPVPASSPRASPSCVTVAVKRVSAYSGRRPKTRRAKGAGARLTIDRAARLDLISARLTYRHAGRARAAKLRTKDITTGGRAILRFRLPARLVPRLGLGQRVRLKLQLRARSTDSGCPYGTTRTLTLGTKVTWVPRRTAS
jgi:hypothetical protein